MRCTRLTQELGSEKVALLKVPAHQSSELFPSDLDKWLITGNGAADSAANAANHSRGPAFWGLWEAHSRQVYENQWIARIVRRHIVAVGRLWSVSQPGVRPSVPAAHGIPKPAKNMPKLEWEAPDGLALHGTHWFQWFAGPIAIAKRNGTWEVARGEAARLSNHVKVSVRTKWFRLMLQQFLRDARVCYVTCTTRPFSNWVCCHRGSIGFQLKEDVFQSVEGFLQGQLGSPATGSGKLLERVRGI